VQSSFVTYVSGRSASHNDDHRHDAGERSRAGHGGISELHRHGIYW